MPSNTPKELEPKAAPSEKPVATITVTQATMDAVLEKLDAQAKQITMLTEISDKSRKFNWDQKNQDFSQKVAKVSYYKTQMVLGWRTVKDEVFQDGRGIWHEDQRIELILSDNTRVEINYLDFVKFVEKKSYSVISRYITPEGKPVIRLDVDGKEVDIDEVFIN